MEMSFRHTQLNG